MNLHNFFETNTGTGVLSTANKNGEVNSAIYARPHIEDGHHSLARTAKCR